MRNSHQFFLQPWQPQHISHVHFHIHILTTNSFWYPYLHKCMISSNKGVKWKLFFFLVATFVASLLKWKRKVCISSDMSFLHPMDSANLENHNTKSLLNFREIFIFTWNLYKVDISIKRTLLSCQWCPLYGDFTVAKSLLIGFKVFWWS